MAEHEDVRAAQDRMRRMAYESGGKRAVDAAEKHIKASTPAMESEARRRQGKG